jgi:hypothetical protein
MPCRNPSFLHRSPPFEHPALVTLAELDNGLPTSRHPQEKSITDTKHSQAAPDLSGGKILASAPCPVYGWTGRATACTLAPSLGCSSQSGSTPTQNPNLTCSWPTTHDVAAELWSATSYKALREEAVEVDRYNRSIPPSSPASLS